jgi:ABC-type sugar transport system ATPase subunit
VILGEEGVCWQVALTEPLGVETVVHLRSGEQTLTCLLPGITHLKIGETVRFKILNDRIHCFNLDGNRVQV